MIDVILPALDEAAALPGVLGRLPAGYRALVVDNGSADGTADVALAHGAAVVHEPQRGFGSACWAGLQAADAELVAFLDADGSCDPAELVGLAGPVIGGEAELSIGERLASPGAWPFHARVANRMLAWEVRRRTGLRLRDLGPMRVARRADLLALGLADRRSGWPLEMVLKANAAGWRVVGSPVGYQPRTGRSKVTGTVRGTLQAVSDMGRFLR